MPHKKQRLVLGAHMSISGGIEKSILRGESIGCTTIQIFTKSNRQWKARPLTKDEIELFKKTAQESSIKPIVAHTSYLINIGAVDKSTHKKSQDSLQQELIRCEQLEIPYLVLHPGAYTNGTKAICLETIAHTLNNIFADTPGKTMILLENMAGQGSTIGHSFEQLATIYEKSTFQKRLGICFDTCHGFAAGYDLRPEKGYNALWKKFDTTLGLDLLKCIHLNDSKKGLGSRVDRHEHIGKGKIDLDAFKFLMNDQRFFEIAKIIETPKNDLIDDKKNLEALIQLLSEENQKKFLCKE